MISELTIKKLYSLLDEEEKDILKLSIIETYGEDVGKKVDKNPAIQDSINQLIYHYVKSKHSDQVDKLLFDVNESVDDQHQAEKMVDSAQEEAPTIKSFAVNSNCKSEISAEQLNISTEVPVVAEAKAAPNTNTNTNTNSDEESSSKNNNSIFNFNLILDGRSKSSIYIDKLLGGLDEESREIVVKCLLYISIFIAIISLILIILNTSNINQIQSLYEEGQRNFLFQYTDVCNIDVNLAKNNPCVISEINKRISELSISRFWNTIGLGIFSILSLFFFYQISTYRQTKDKAYN